VFDDTEMVSPPASTFLRLPESLGLAGSATNAGLAKSFAMRASNRRNAKTAFLLAMLAGEG
jgi:hypothetical protein